MAAGCQFLIATDEAGYGPNLGPLVVATTVWEVPRGVGHADLYDRLRDFVVADRPSRGDPRIRVADSKRLYQPGSGVLAIERGTLAALGSIGPGSHDRWRELWRTLSPGSLAEISQIPWYADYDESLPIAVPAAGVRRDAATLGTGWQQAGVRLLGIESATLFAGQFNRKLAELGNKSTVLSHLTLELVRRRIRSLPPGPIHILCDKHGGRNRYAGMLQACFGDFIQVRYESKASSLYCWGHDDRRIECCFQAKADHVLAAALASMAAKYLRELAMRAFNHFWQARREGLRPTAGYPTDARRFRSEIADSFQQLGVAESLLWRER